MKDRFCLGGVLGDFKKLGKLLFGDFADAVSRRVAGIPVLSAY